VDNGERRWFRIYGTPPPRPGLPAARRRAVLLPADLNITKVRLLEDVFRLNEGD